MRKCIRIAINYFLVYFCYYSTSVCSTCIVINSKIVSLLIQFVPMSSYKNVFIHYLFNVKKKEEWTGGFIHNPLILMKNLQMNFSAINYSVFYKYLQNQIFLHSFNCNDEKLLKLLKNAIILSLNCCWL